MSMTIRTDLSGLNASLDVLGEVAESAVRPAAQAGAEVLYQAVKRNVAGLGRKTGNLDRSIYQAFSKNHSGADHATYHISWNAKKAPHGHLIERGHIQKFKVYLGKDGRWYTNKKAPLATPVQIAARPFVRSAAGYFPAALDAAEVRLFKEMKL